MLRKLIVSLILFLTLAFMPAAAQAERSGSVSGTYSAHELVQSGSAFFGSLAQGMAAVVEKAVSQYGLPNGYILGEEGSGAFLAGARYGQGRLYTRNAGEHVIYWQGPTIGLDFGGDGSKVMMLVYNLPTVPAVFGRYPGVDGSAFVIGGLGMTVVKRNHVVIVPIRSGIGARLGVNVGYLKFTRKPTWNPF